MRKILFNNKYGLTDAVRDGRKTNTRRRAYDGEIKDIHIGYMTEGVDAGRLALCDGNMIVAKSKYKLGEVVAVAQSYKDLGYTKEWVEQHISPNPNAKPTDPFEKKYPGWNNKMFVPSELNNALKIQITDIKVERLQDISDEDVYKEGFRKEAINNGWGNAAWHWEAVLTYMDGLGRYKQIRSENPKEAFSCLIDKLSGLGTWDRNDWQFAYSFKLIK